MPTGSEMLLAAVRAATEGEYTIERELGRGGMAAVYLARDIQLDRRVAIKVMLPDLVEAEGLADRFLVEARTSAHLDHPGIVTVYSVKQREGMFFIVMKYIAGNTLDAVLRAGPPVPADVASTLIAQVAEALQYAHGEGIVHRDVKPSNILVDVRGRPVIADFGIAKVTASTSVTATGALIGTPAYMSPEQCRGLPATFASDQYALGIVAYEMLARRLPFTGSLFELIHAHCDAEPPALQTLVPDIDPRLADVVMRMMAKHPKDRWPSLADVVRVFVRDAARGRGSATIRSAIADMARAETVAGVMRPPISDPSGDNTKRMTTPAPALVITPPDPSLEVGATLQLRVSESSGASLVGIRIEWRTEDPSVATVDADGRITGEGAGLAKVTATGGSAVGRITVTVRETAVNTLVVTPQNPDVDANDELQLVVTALDARGNVMPRQTVVWVSSDVAICAISQQGRAIGVTPGRASITAQLGEVSGTTAVRVRPPAVTRIVLDPGEFSIEVEEKRAVTASVLGPMDRALKDRSIQWRSSVPTVAVVSADGVVEGVMPGTAAIIAACDGREGICSVSVRAQPVAAIRIQPARLQLELGRSLQLQGIPEDRKGRALPDRSLEWHSDDERIALVDTSGKVHGTALGRTTVTAISNAASSSIEVVVVPRPVAQVHIVAHEPSLRVGAHMQLDVVLVDSDGGALSGRDVAWTTSDVTIASVTKEGVVHARKPGAVRLTVTCEQARATTKLGIAAPAPPPPVPAAPRVAAPVEATVAASPKAPRVATAPPSVAAREPARRSHRTPVIVGVAILVAGGAYAASKLSSARDGVTAHPAAAQESTAASDTGGRIPVPSASGEQTRAPEGGLAALPPVTKRPPSNALASGTKSDSPAVPRGARGAVADSGGRVNSARVRADSIAVASAAAAAAAGRGDTARRAPPPVASPPVVSAPLPRPDPVAPTLTPIPAAGRGSGDAPATNPAADRALLCGSADGAASALNSQVGNDPGRQLLSLYQPRDKGFEDLGSLIKGAQRLRAVARAVRNETVGTGCEWVMSVDLTWTNAFGQPRRRTIQLRSELESAGASARVKRLFSATGF